MKRRLLAIAMTLAMALSLLPVTALAEGTEDRTGSEPVGSEQQVLTNEPSDEGATTPTDEESATDTETPVEDPEQGTEPTDEVGSGEEGTGGPGEGYIVQGRNDNYQTVAEALDAGETSVKLIGDLTENIVISSDDELVLDLDEYTITNDTAEETKDTIYVELGGELTINGAGTVDNVSNGKAAIFNNGTVTLNGGKYTRSQENGDSTENSGGNSYYNILNHGVMTINEGVTVEQDGAFSSLIANGYYSYTETNERSGYVEGTNQAEPQLTINGGTFSGGINTIKNDDNAELVIYDGLITNVTQAAVQNNNVATIYGGTFEAEGYDALQNRHFNTAYNAGELTVSGGEFTGNLLTTTGATWSITGGTFSQDVSDYVADGYICEKSGDDYVVSELNADNSVAQVDDEYYQTLAEAVEAIVTSESKSGTVTLLKDAQGSGIGLFNSKGATGVNLTIDFGGHVYTCDDPAVGSAGYESQGFHLEKGNTVTLKNGTIQVAADSTGTRMLIQNYCDLTLEDLTLTGSDVTQYIISCNYGDMSLTNVNISGTYGNGLVAIDLMHWLNNSYRDKAPTMTVDNTAENTISGSIDVYCSENGANKVECEVVPTLTITGGTFSTDVNAYCPTGYAAEKDENTNTWTVVPKQGMEADVSTGADNTASATVDGSYTGSESDEGSGDGSVTAGATIQINVATGTDGAADESITKTEVTVGGAALESVQNATGVQNVEITTDVGTVTLDKDAWNSIADNAGDGSVTLTIQKAEDADGPADWTVSVVDEDGNPVFSSEDERSGEITISVPYEDTVPEESQIVVYYIGENGQLESMVTTCQNGTLSWTTDHLSDYGSVTIDADDQAVWVSDNALKAGSLADALTDLDAVGGTIDLIRSATLDAAKYTISKDVKIQKSAMQEGELTVTATVAPGPGTGAFNITANASLTLDGVKMTINGTSDTENQGGKYDGTGFILNNTDSGTGGKLILTNADVELNGLQRGMVFQVTASNLSSVEMTNSQLTIQNIDGNASNGGVWTVGEGSTVTVQNCGDHGLSASSVTVKNGATVAVSNVGYRGISINDAGGKLEIQTGGTVTVANACTAEGYTGSAVVMSDNATGGLQVAQGGTLTVTGANSEIQLSDADGVTNKLEGNITGTYTGAVIMVGDQAFEDLAEALTAASTATDKTVTLLGDVETTSAITIPEGVTLDGNNFEIKYIGEGIQNGAFITAGGDGVIIQNATINTNNGAKHGVNFFNADNGKLSGVTVNGGYWTAVQVIGSTGVVLEDCDLNPTAVAGDSGKTPYANIEYGLSDSSQSAGGTIPSLTVDNVTFTSGIPQIWVDQDTVENIKKEMEEAGTSNPTNSQVQEKVNSSITNNNSDDIIVSIELTDGNVTDSTVDGTDDDDNGGGSHGGGSSVTRYNVTVEDTDNGSIRVSPSRASRGQTVTITVSPDDGYELDRLVVRDADGDRIDVERQSDTRYTFEMPRSRVTVEATFAEIVEEDAIPFRDVDTDDWFYDAVVYAYDTGLMSGVSDREFAPNSTLTRAMVAQMLWALEDKPQVNYLMAYDDVDSGAWFGEAVRWASSEGLMSGYSDTAFGPNDPVTREQLALILYNYARDKGYDVDGGRTLGSYLDADSVSVWAVSALEWAVDAGLISGRGEGLLAPSGTATRAEVAQIFMNFLENVAR